MQSSPPCEYSFWGVLECAAGTNLQVCQCRIPADETNLVRRLTLFPGLQVWRDTESRAREPVTIWKPRPPAGYVAIGSVVVPDYCEPEREVIRCVRRDRAGNVALGQVPLWRDYKGAAIWHCSLWQVQNEAHTFLAKRDHQPPPPNLAYTVL